MSAVAVELTIRGLAGLEEPVSVTTDPATGFPTLGLGRTVTSADVADLLDDE